MKIGTVLVTRSQTEIELTGATYDDFTEGKEYVVTKMNDSCIFLEDDDLGAFTIEPDKYGLSYKTFFTVKGQ